MAVRLQRMDTWQIYNKLIRKKLESHTYLEGPLYLNGLISLLLAKFVHM